MLRLVGRSTGFADDETRLLATIADRLAVDLEQEPLREEANRAEVLRRTDELRTALLSSVSHDLRTPLAAIKASGESLLQDDVPWSDEDRAGFAEAIVRESDRLNRLVGNLLDMSRIEGGALRPQRDWYDAGELVREVVGRLRSDAARAPRRARDRRRSAAGLARLPDDRPGRDEPARERRQVHAARDADRRAGRARRRSNPGRDRRSRAGHPARQARRPIFDKFYRLDDAAPIQGSGLGLAVSKGLVEGHDGRIWVEETPGGGATFVFELPVGEERAGAPTAVARRNLSNPLVLLR